MLGNIWCEGQADLCYNQCISNYIALYNFCRKDWAVKIKACKNLLEYAMLLKVKSAMKKSKRPDTGYRTGTGDGQRHRCIYRTPATWSVSRWIAVKL